MPLLRVHKHTWRIAATASAILLGFVALRVWFPWLDRHYLIDLGHRLPDAGFLGALVILPLLGVPISVFLIVLGLKYGTLWGMIFATAATVLHNLAAYLGTKTWFQAPIERALRKLGYSIPHIPAHHQLWFTAVFVAVPGLPYAIKLYSLALTNISFRIYFWVGWPLYALSCIVYVALGAAAATLSIGWFVAVLVGGLAILWAARWFWQRRGLRAARPPAS